MTIYSIVIILLTGKEHYVFFFCSVVLFYFIFFIILTTVFPSLVNDREDASYLIVLFYLIKNTGCV